ncbi:MAG TPA: hydroxymethylbilane synthase [Gemmatimonadales bacterium]|nr:hydroxymethylbilane synthase [Gemmatimonadales bacterium]
MTAAPARVLRGGTRRSPLARWQTARIRELLRQRGVPSEEVAITTEGDRILDRPLPEIGGKGLFTEALEEALRAGAIDFAVHSLKDLPVEPVPDIIVAAVCLRGDPRDVLVARDGHTLRSLPTGAAVGTSSTRRIAQLRAIRPDLTVLPLRGNVDTRVHKAQRGDYDGIVLAAAGVVRLGLGDTITEVLPLEVMLPAPGQGALAVQCRVEDTVTRELLAALDDLDVRAATDAERGFLAALGGGCSAPVAALAEVGGSATLRLTGLVAASDGSKVIRVTASRPVAEATRLATGLAEQAIHRGARDLL